MESEVLPTAEDVARRGAEAVAAEARDATAERGRFLFAVSGGSTPWKMLAALADEDVPWDRLEIFQVDERVAPDGHPDRNLTRLHESLLTKTPIREEQVHAMPVTEDDLDAAAARYAALLREFGGTPPVLDLVHLGLGSDGHTASLVPGDPVLDVTDRDVAATTGEYEGRRRLTLTWPILERSRRLLWLVTGESKVPVVPRLVNGDGSIPAGRVRHANALLIADAAATGDAGPTES
jgi:6-phosphogluconolactonase